MLNKRFYKDAIDVQDACNPLGVTKGFAQVTQAIWDDMPEGTAKSMDALQRHPVFVMWAAKIASMARVDFGISAFEHAYNECKRIAGVE